MCVSLSVVVYEKTSWKSCDRNFIVTFKHHQSYRTRWNVQTPQNDIIFELANRKTGDLTEENSRNNCLIFIFAFCTQ